MPIHKIGEKKYEMEENTMKKKLSIVLLSSLMAFNTCGIVGYADEGITVTLNGDKIEFDVQPQLINDRTMVPFRKIFEAMGAYVDWYGDTQTVVAIKDDKVVTAKINDNNLYINGVAKTLDVPSMIIDGRTLVPARFVAESFGANVGWDGVTQTVVITSIPSLTFLSEPSGYFEMNSVNGVKVYWGAKNASKKTINYYTINYSFINPVGDLAYDEITGKAQKSVKTVGPVKTGENILSGGIIGYVPTCYAVRIDSIYLEYADDTTELVNCGQNIFELSETGYSSLELLDKILN